MPNPLYSQWEILGPRVSGTAAETTGNSKKSQKGGWAPASALGRSGGAGRVSTTKGNGARVTRVSTNKPEKNSEGSEGAADLDWRCSTNKGGGYG